MRNYFEGWYFKHTMNEDNLIFIPGYHRENGVEKAFIQVIYKDEFNYFEFDKKELTMDETQIVQIGLNKFSLNKIEINLENESIKIVGNIIYQNITPLTYKIMGPFSYVPIMECKHEILSLHHQCTFDLTINENIIKTGGIGYIEKDWGTSFPTSYCWLQGNDFNQKASVFVAIASIDYFKISFTGILGIVYFNNQEIRFATYLGAKVVRCNNTQIVITQGSYKLLIHMTEKKGVELPAPMNGSMKRTIHETIKTAMRVQLFHHKQCLFDQASMNASVEMVNMIK